MSVTRPICRYHGGKFRLADWIISNLPAPDAYDVYVEPFGGAGSVLLKKQRSHAEIYNDLDSDMVNLFRVARDHGDELKRVLELTPYARVEYDHACEFPSGLSEIEMARRTVVRAAMGRDSASATMDRKSTFRVYTNPEGRSLTPMDDWVSYPVALVEITKRLYGVVLENLPAIELIANYDRKGVLFYVDPPYVAQTRDHTTGDYRHEMTDADHAQLLEVLKNLKGMAVISGYESPLYSEALQGWKKVSKKARADSAKERKEILWISPNCADVVGAQMEL